MKIGSTIGAAFRAIGRMLGALWQWIVCTFSNARRWLFRDREAGGCEVDFFVDFEFKNRVLQSLIGVVFNEAMRRIVGAFEARAAALYGAPSTA